MRITTLALISALVLSSAPARGQTSQQQPPSFRVGVDILAVDVNVVDDRGRPITDLLAPEFTVKVDDQVRNIVSAEFIRFGDGVGFRRAADAAPAHFSSNEGTPPGRVVVIVVDQGNMRVGAGPALASEIDRLLDRFNPSDRVALVTIPAPGPSVPFTNRFDQIRETIARVVGTAPMPKGTHNLGLSEALMLDTGTDPTERSLVLNRECGEFPAGTENRERCEDQVFIEAANMAGEVRARTSMTLAAMRSLFRSLAEIEGPKTMVFVSEGLVLEDRYEEIQLLGPAAASARVTLNVVLIDPAPVDVSTRSVPRTPFRDRELHITGLEMMAGWTRGGIFRDVGAGGASFERVVNEMSGFYLLGVETTPRDRDGKRHRITVEVKRRGATVRSRREFIFEAEREASRNREEIVGQTLRTPVEATEVPLRITSYALQDQDSPKVRVVVAAEIGGAAPAPEYSVGLLLTDADGNVVTSGGEQAATPAGTAGPLQYSTALLVEPGIYRVKLAAVDPAGQRGSVEHEVEAWKLAGEEFAVGDMFLGNVAPSGDGGLKPSVVARLEDDTLVAYTEIYGTDPARLDASKVTIEIASDDSAPAIASVPATLRAGGDPQRRSVQAVVPVHVLPPGAYLARATIESGGRTVGKLSRPFEVRRSAAAREAAAGTAVVASMAVRGTDGAKFRREDIVHQDVTAYFLDALAAKSAGGAPEVKAAIAAARGGKLQGAARLAFEGGDQLAAAFLRGLELFTSGQVETAANQFRAATTVAPDFAPAAFYLGACFAAAGRDREAGAMWGKALPPGAPPAVYEQVADLWIRLNDGARAIAALKEGLGRWPDRAPLERRLGLAYAATGDHAAAVEALDSYLAKSPSDAEALFVAVLALYEARSAGKPTGSPEQERERAARYARAYRAANGPQQALVSKWADFVAESAPATR